MLVLTAFNSTPASSLTKKSEPRPLAWPPAKVHVPNLTDVQPGDIVLVRGTRQGVSATLESIQKKFSSSCPPVGDPSWTHVAIYAGEGLLLEAVSKQGVRYVPLHSYCESRDVLVRRYADNGVAISLEDGAKIVRHGMSFFGSNYSVPSFLYFSLRRNRDDSLRQNQFVCSSFVAYAYIKGIRVGLGMNRAYDPLFPGTLAGHADFDDVALEWRVAY